IHQSVPMEEKATITLSLSAKDQSLSIEKVMGTLRNIQHVYKVELISMSM
ncbi:MAG: ACT domain-containing protein, partial [Staphylococcus sp.]|nr:ACT domain-containing protein [Staphylococcus sp.]